MGLSWKNQELLSRCFGSAEQASASPDERPSPSTAIHSPTAPVTGNSLQSGGGDRGVTKSGTHESQREFPSPCFLAGVSASNADGSRSWHHGI